jgi:hypothetical protein
MARDVQTYRYTRPGSEDVHVVRAWSCDIAAGRVTWRDIDGRIILSRHSDDVGRLSCDEAEGDADERLASTEDACPWCEERRTRDRRVLVDMRTGHMPGCPHARHEDRR